MEQCPKTEAEQVGFFNAFHDRFLRAVEKAGVIRTCYEVAGTKFRLSFAGPDLVDHITPALEHVQIPPVEQVEVDLCLWDSASTGVPAPRPPCNRADLTDRGDIWGFNSRRIKTAFHYSDYSVNLLDHENDLGLYWIQDADKLPYWTDASPLRTLFHWCLERRGGQLVHGAAVGTPEGAVLITGKGGVGKSTSALACLDAGWFYLGDDYVVIRGGNEAKVCSLYATAKLNADHLHRFPQFSEFVSNPGKLEQEKAVLYLHPQFSDRIKLEMPLKAILEPRLGNREQSEAQPGVPAVIRQAACFTTMSQLPYVGRHTYEFFRDLCSALPSYVLELGTDLDTIPRCIAGILEGADQPVAEETPGLKEAQPAGQEPLVSVIIPVYNGERFIREALENVLSQAYPSIEVIVVDDGSTDDTETVVRDFPFDIRYFKLENNGAAAARNWGIRDSSGDLIAFLDVDDLWPENNLNMLVNEMSLNPELDVLRGHAQLMEYIPESGAYEFRGNPEESFKDYIGAGLYRKRVFTKVGLFDPTLQFGEDNDWYNRARELKAPMQRLDAVTLFVRRHGRNMTHGKSLLEMNMLRVFKKALDRDRERLQGSKWSS